MTNNDRINLIRRISELEGLTDHERSALLGLLREGKTYGLVWEDKPEAVAGACPHQRQQGRTQPYPD